MKSKTIAAANSTSAAEKTRSLETFTASGTNEAATMCVRFAKIVTERAKHVANLTDIVAHWAALWGNSGPSIAVTWAMTVSTAASAFSINLISFDG